MNLLAGFVMGLGIGSGVVMIGVNLVYKDKSFVAWMSPASCFLVALIVIISLGV